jgi:hypothetical protein
MRQHQHAVDSEQRRYLVVIACIECGAKILGQIANCGFHIESRTVSADTAAKGPVHQTTSWGEQGARSFRPGNELRDELAL